MSLKTVSPADVVSAQVIRPNDLTQYAAGEVVDANPGTGLTFSAAARGAGLTGSIVDALLQVQSNQPTKGDFECWLFNQALTAYDADNTLFTPTDGDLANCVGVLQFATPVVGNPAAARFGNVIYRAAKTFLPLSFDTASGDLFGVIVVRNTYTPVATAPYTISLTILQD